MFGYVRPLRGELKVKDFDAYRSVYCGLCHTLGERYGFAARMTLNYDFTFLTMLLSYREPQPQFHPGRCPAHPTKRKPMCTAGPGMEAAADESVILTYWKLRDNVADSGFFRGIPGRVGALLLRRDYRKAAALRPDFNRAVTEHLAALSVLEGEKSPSLDRTADAFAKILSAAAPRQGDEVADRALEQILYHVGRWIYLIDGMDDLEDDAKHGSYNPIAARFGGTPDLTYLRTTLQHSLALAQSAFQLVDFGPWSEILGNILYLGLPTVEQLVLSGGWREAQKTIGRMTE